MTHRQLLTYVEVDIDYCSNTYGVAPCTASIPTTGLKKCFNCPATCQDRVNLTPQTVTLVFAEDCGYLPKEIKAFPMIPPGGVNYTPGVISIGEDLGERGTVTVQFVDRPHSDEGIGFDKYVADRAYNPWETGTFWGKFRARQPYIINNEIRIYQGHVGQTSLAEMDMMTFIITDSTPTGAGGFEIKGQDVLRLIDKTRALAPRRSTGYLDANITSGATAATLAPTGVGNAEYAASGWLALGRKEIVSFTRVNDALTITRGQLGTTAVAHKAEDSVQTVLYYNGEDPADILYDLYTDYGSIDAGYINLPEWQGETAGHLQRLYTRVIPEPTAVAALASSLIKQAALVNWWEPLEAKLKLQVIRGVITSGVDFTNANTLGGSVNSKEQPEKRISQSHTYFAPINPFESDDKPENYRSVAVDIAATIESEYGSPVIDRTYGSWIPENGRAIAQRHNDIKIGRFAIPPRLITLDMLNRKVETPSLGAGCLVSDKDIFQLDTGEPDAVPGQIIRFNPFSPRLQVTIEEMRFEVAADFNDRYIPIETDQFNLNGRTIYDTLYPVPQVGDVIIFIIASGVIVGSVNTSLPGFDLGSWPVGVIPIIRIFGRIQGCGGLGGSGKTSGSGRHGLPGGTALKVAQACEIEGTGQIFGGGGGGGGGGLGNDFSGVKNGGGGGGGSGYLPGAGGEGANSGGASGTTEAGGAGSSGAGNAGDGRSGGGFGAAGVNGQNGGFTNGGNGGAAGNAIDGNSFVTETGTLTVTGPRVG